MTTLGKRVEIGDMLAMYGLLLTDKQRQALSLHYDEDLSLGEIAKQFGVSRQNVYELMTRGEEQLRRYEDALHMAYRVRETGKRLSQVEKLLESGADQQEISRLLRRAQADLEGEENGV